MGRQRWTTRLTVESCPIFLCMTVFYRGGLFDVPQGFPLTVMWPGLWGLPMARLECHLAERSPSKLTIVIPSQLALPDLSITEQSISLTTTRPHLGGNRYWFLCGCGRRAGRLYLPAGQRLFRCRRCYNLIQRSAQEHDQRIYDLAKNREAMGAALRSNELRKSLLGVSALVLLARRPLYDRHIKAKA